MTLRNKDLLPSLQKFIAVHEAMMRFGFSPDDVWAEAGMSEATRRVSAFLVLRTQGKDFSVELGPVASEETFVQAYTDMANRLPEMPKSDREKLWKKHISKAWFSTLAQMLVAKGFRLPALNS